MDIYNEDHSKRFWKVARRYQHVTTRLLCMFSKWVFCERCNLLVFRFTPRAFV